jgi:2-deoxy-D-gluconate 3-dehydrogenase
MSSSAKSTYDVNNVINLEGKRALIIGAGRGIGKKIAHYFAQAGAGLTLVSRTEAELEAVKKEILNETGSVVDVFAADATDEHSISKIFSSLHGLDILVNVAGTSGQVPAEKYNKDLFSRIYGLNCHALFFACAQSYPLLCKSRTGGRIINISSHLGVVGLPLRTIYCSSKAAVIHFTKTLAAEWAKDHITVNCIAPGYTNTELSQLVLNNSTFRDEVLSKTPVGFIAETDDIAGAAVFLASPASRYMTGQTLVIDGGWSCV